VLGSQKTFATVLSGNRFSFLKEPSSCLKFLANSIRSKSLFWIRSFIEKDFTHLVQTASISTFTPSGRDETSTVALAG
jgi:hypothetical protein